ncbi:hypothetical protein [Dyadobacter sp. OTU695]|uniref:hypothetical protein n=1 Tax=Dyadobacter sp. OTU695 TaxID=3043860 RepID=UPI00313ECA9A
MNLKPDPAMAEMADILVHRRLGAPASRRPGAQCTNGEPAFPSVAIPHIVGSVFIIFNLRIL